MRLSKQRLHQIIQEEYAGLVGNTGNIIEDGLRDFDKVMNSPAVLKHEGGEEKAVKVDALQDAIGDIYDPLRDAMTKVLEKIQEVFNSPAGQGAEIGFKPGNIVTIGVISNSVILRAKAMIKGRRQGQPDGEIQATAQVDRRTGDIKHGPTIKMGKTR